MSLTFCNGAARQHMTDLQSCAISTNSLFSGSSRVYDKLMPSIIKASGGRSLLSVPFPRRVGKTV